MKLKRHKDTEISEEKTEKFDKLNVNYTTYKTILTKKFLNRQTYNSKNNNIINSKMPGTIKKINVSKGDIVKKGDVLCIIDSMKMNNNILSSLDGEVIDIFVKVDEVICKNAKIMEVKPNENKKIINDDQNILYNNDKEFYDEDFL